MKRLEIKLRARTKGQYTRVTVFTGNEGETLANCGELTLRPGDYQLFGALLGLGTKNSSAAVHAVVTFDEELQT